MATEIKEQEKDIFSKSYTEMSSEELNFVKARMIYAKEMAEKNSKGMTGSGKRKMREICDKYEVKLAEIRKVEALNKQETEMKGVNEQQGPTN